MKKLLGIVVLGLLWCNVSVAETFFIKCTSALASKYQDTYIFEIKERIKKISLVGNLEKHKIEILEFNKKKLKFKILDVGRYTLDETTNDFKILWSADITIDINRVSGIMGKTHPDPSKNINIVEPFECGRTKAKI